ncbi:protein NipSnap-like [Rhopalosiphum maidis]|uniref:protein NipSnap-like n=1 Tax=Rhopalosiphum maidis TaxID=43146 RepID=UPI000EFF4188|nr:protein NipSnap-like [Rhopalosiphum maidis]
MFNSILKQCTLSCTKQITVPFQFRSLSFNTASLKDNKELENNTNEGWLKKLLVRRIEPTKEQHSRMLSDKEVIYELQTHNVRPDSTDNYMKNYEQVVQLCQKIPNLKYELIGSWSVRVGDLDQYVHLWKHQGGYAEIDKTNNILIQNQEYAKLRNQCGQFLRSRHLQYLLAFSFWPSIELKSGSNIYEIRSYSLKPGTMIEWGNNWARAINHRRSNDEPFAGFFSQVGRLYNVHHFWCYKNLEVRTQTREAAWMSPGWDECVAYTVPLIKEMQSKILHPTPFSPTQ